MAMRRRELLAGLGGLLASAALDPRGLAALRPATERGPRLGDRRDFDIADGVTYLNSAAIHPLPVRTRDAVRAYAEERSTAERMDGPSESARRRFARLINAAPSEIAFIPNTSTGENLVVNGLRIPERAGNGINVVTDALHFEGALIHLQALERYHGLDLRIARPRDFRIELSDLERLVDRNTALVEVSLVARYNGFQHDLEAVCELAHAHGAYVYADIIQAAGAMPIDVRASGVDFCACAGYKWLMSDSPGFLYAREDLLGTAIQRSQWAHYSTTGFHLHFRPHDPPGDAPVSWRPGSNATAFFELGSRPDTAHTALDASLGYLMELGIDNIRARRQPLLRRLRDELPGLGFELVTPPETTSPIITFATADGRRAAERLDRAGVVAAVGGRGTWANHLRLSPSVFNDMADVERVLDALS